MARHNVYSRAEMKEGTPVKSATKIKRKEGIAWSLDCNLNSPSKLARTSSMEVDGASRDLRWVQGPHRCGRHFSDPVWARRDAPFPAAVARRMFEVPFRQRLERNKLRSQAAMGHAVLSIAGAEGAHRPPPLTVRIDRRTWTLIMGSSSIPQLAKGTLSQKFGRPLKASGQTEVKQ
jgi:hypothetical protein